jgi:periplasmic divalent cation tolerance protein
VTTTDARLVVMTAPDRATAESLAKSVVGERLAACASLVPGLTSLFWWEGRVQRADEVLLLLKTQADRVPALIARAAELHPYDVPEVLALPVDAGFGPYLEWVRVESRPRGSA